MMKTNRCTNGGIICNKNMGPIFGEDLVIISDSDTSSECTSNLGHEYKHANFIHDSGKAKQILGGARYFSLYEIEVFTNFFKTV